ncbi:phage tail tube protein [Clostridium saccharoperbutylacetonicum]|uniref:phage tail tube protein n=1 Tax=Clostridium saccharoperbutylacetonicum TaxID=36745 RepID=UPI000983A7C1|nr:phage tail tube protein [Clostridium saccharoperbutylacetonicum]AQR93394.1 hypothetical protein CLSAP_06920 [Clostridium saccharoperbutylacetonicum]NSB29091.1 hypothetical protein [Clostridium saccharoperbutylacetonicum]
MSKKTIDPYRVLIGNKGHMKIDGIEIAELKNLKIKITPEMKEISLLDSVTKGKIMTNVSGKITFEFNKIYSRFKPAVLECYKYLQPFSFTLEATVYTPDKSGEETIYIGNCWLDGDIDIFELNADADFLTEKFDAEFQIESADFTDVIDDKHEWETKSYKTVSNN